MRIAFIMTIMNDADNLIVRGVPVTSTIVEFDDGALAIGQQQQRAFAQAQGSNTGHQLVAGFFGFEQHHGAGWKGYCLVFQQRRMTP